MVRIRDRRLLVGLVAAAIGLPLIGGITFFREKYGSSTTRTSHRSVTHPSLAKQLRQSVEVIGHRGNSDAAPENTLAAIETAFAVGATMVEVDVRLSRDGIPVVIHDETLERTTNGEGPVAAMTSSELSLLDAGSWKGPAYAGERIPSLAALFRAAKGKGRVLLDLKVEGMGAAIAQVARSVGLGHDALAVGTWTETQTTDSVRHLQGAEVLQSDTAPQQWDDAFFGRQRARGVTGFEIPSPWSADFVAAAHRHGMPVYAYTINDERLMRDVVAMGIDGIETDVPALLVRVLRELTNQQK